MLNKQTDSSGDKEQCRRKGKEERILRAQSIYQ